MTHVVFQVLVNKLVWSGPNSLRTLLLLLMQMDTSTSELYAVSSIKFCAMTTPHTCAIKRIGSG